MDAPKAGLQDAAAVQEVLRDMMTASNHHDLDGVIRHYAPSFSSGDSLSVKDIRGLIQDTWTMFPDIRYESQILEIRINGNWATVESIDTAIASAKVDPVVSAKPGTMKSRSRGMLYLHRIGKSWEIISDATLYEKATIVYGPFENVNVDLETPEQVFSGDAYTAKVKVGVPSGNIAFATLSQEPLTYPQHASKDKFRTLSSDKTDLERVFKANATNNNEVVTATVGFTEIGQDDQERPTINLKGIMTIVKRVNVTPKSTFAEASPAQKVVHITADGKVKMDAAPAAASPDDDSDSPSDDAPPSQD
jgi:ketosteroid isomerase-like protein